MPTLNVGYNTDISMISMSTQTESLCDSGFPVANPQHVSLQKSFDRHVSPGTSSQPIRTMIETTQAGLNKIPHERASVLDKSPDSELRICQYHHLSKNERIRFHLAELQNNLINELKSYNN